MIDPPWSRTVMAAARPATPAPMTTTSAVWSHLIWALASAVVAPVSAAAPTPAAAPFDRKDLRLSASGAPPLSLRSCVPIASSRVARLYLPAILTLWAAGSRQHISAASAHRQRDLHGSIFLCCHRYRSSARRRSGLGGSPLRPDR